MSFLTQLNWRYATKKFDTSKKVLDEQLATIQNAIKMAPTSFGLQPVHVVLVSNPELRAKLQPLAYNQSQIVDSSHVFVFCARTDLVERTEDFMNQLSQGSAEARISLKGYEDAILGVVSGMSPERAHGWAARQAYIGLGFGLAACAELEIDACPMEGFDPEAFKAVLELPAHITPVALMAVGYRAADDIIRPKFRFDDIFETRA